MKLSKVLIICSILAVLVSCGKDNKVAGANTSSESNSLNYSLTDGTCSAAHSFSGTNAEETKRNYCQGLMNDKLNNDCASNERQRLFYTQKCDELEMVYDSNHYYYYNSAPYYSKFKVRYNYSNPNAWFYIKIQGNTYEEYQYELKKKLLDNQLRFEMGSYRRRQMFYRHFPGQTYYIY